jgi:hypothetical protein
VAELSDTTIYGDLTVEGEFTLPNENIYDSGWVEVSLLNSWVAYDAIYGKTDNKIVRKINGVVYIQGLLKNGTISTNSTGYMFRLPEGYRPPITLIFRTICSGGATQLRVRSDGYVHAYAGSANAWYSVTVNFSV